MAFQVLRGHLIVSDANLAHYLNIPSIQLKRFTARLEIRDYTVIVVRDLSCYTQGYPNTSLTQNFGGTALTRKSGLPASCMASDSDSQQSWTAWVLSAYASSVAPTYTEDAISDDSNYESMSPTYSESSSEDTSSPYGPYARTGRGGAGNFQWQPERAADIEAQRPVSLKEKRAAARQIEHIDTGLAIQNAKARATSQYVRVGRGGAGNMPYVQSNEIQQSPRATSMPLKSPLTATSPVMYTGRGGAGNHSASKAAAAQVKALKEKEQQLEADKRWEQAEQDVSNTLQAPTQAWLGGRRKSTAADDYAQEGQSPWG